MKIIFKKSLCVLTVLSCVFTFIGHPFHKVHADDHISITPDDNATLITEEKIYCKATLEDDFADNRVIVVITHEASMGFKTYTTSDFAEVNVKTVSDLTTATANMVQAKVSGTDVVMTNGVTVKSDNKVKVDTYNQIITLELQETGKENVLAAIKELEKRSDVKYAGPDYILSISAYPNDNYSLNDSVIEQIELPDAWDINTGSSSVIVGVLDTGILSSHPDLQYRVASSMNRNFTDVSTSNDTDGHGTHVAGIIGAQANNYDGISGVCWDVKLVSLKVLDNEGYGYASDVVEAVNYANEVDIPILNLSARWYQSDSSYSSMQDAIENYTGLFVCAAGNETRNNDQYGVYPANYRLNNLISVGSCDLSDNVSTFSNYGQNNVDIFAPGEDIKSCWLNNEYKFLDGTSMAAPLVTGVAALILSEFPNFGPEELKTAIMTNVDESESLTTKCVSGGRLNAYKALSHPIHSISYVDNGSDTNHSVVCYECGYTYEETHNWSYQSTGDSLRHNVVCTNCSKTKQEVHNWVERPLIGDQQCSKCKQTLTGFAPIIKGSISDDEDSQEE